MPVSAAAQAQPTVTVEPVGPGLREPWRRLWRSIPDASPFLSPEWLLAWAEIYAPGRCTAAALWAGGELVALLPVFTWEGALRLAGTGPSDHGGVLIRADYAGWTASLVEAAADEPERIVLEQLEPGSPLCSCAIDGWCGDAEAGVPCPVLAVSGADGMDGVPKRLRANWLYAVRRLEREGGRVERVGPQDVPDTLAALERLHAARWQAKGEAGVLGDPLLTRMLQGAAGALAEADMLRLYRATCGGSTLAVLFALRGQRDLCYFLSGFDPARADLSLGTIVIGAAITDAAHEGLVRFDFLRGRETYKYRWGAEDRPRCRRVLTRYDS